MNFELIERRLLACLSMVPAEFPERERIICKEYIGFGEYGVALEHLCVQLVEYKLQVSLKFFDEVKWLASQMEIDESYVSVLEVRKE